VEPDATREVTPDEPVGVTPAVASARRQLLIALAFVVASVILITLAAGGADAVSHLLPHDINSCGGG
jgi:hypothetical protein